jgi:hypothetical protein
VSGTKLSVSIDQQLAKQVRREARESKLKMSTWITEVIREHLRQKEAKQLLQELDREHGSVPETLSNEVRRQWPED